MTALNTLRAIDARKLAAVAVADEEVPEVMFDATRAEPVTVRPGRPFTAKDIDARLAEADALFLDGGEEEPAADVRAFDFRPGVDPRVAHLPGGDAFEELLRVGDGALVARDFVSVAGFLGEVKRLWKAVTAFFARLRDAIAGFEHELPSDAGVKATFRCAIDADTKLTVRANGAELDTEVLVAVGGAARALASSYEQTLEIFAKVCEIVVTVIKLAVNPASAARALYRALRSLYDLIKKALD